MVPISVLSNATVNVSVALGVVSMPVPAAMVIVSPSLRVWLAPASDPVSMRSKVPPPDDVKHVEQEISPAAESEIGEEAETATVPEALGKVMCGGR